MLGALARSLFGTANDRIVKGFDKPVAKINALEPEFSKLSDEALRGKTVEAIARPPARGGCGPDAVAEGGRRVDTCGHALYLSLGRRAEVPA